MKTIKLKDATVVPLGRGVFCCPLLYEAVTALMAESAMKKANGEEGYTLDDIARKTKSERDHVNLIIQKIRRDERKIAKILSRASDLISNDLIGGDQGPNVGPNGKKLRPVAGSPEALRIDRHLDQQLALATG
jgi:hypothetical protein